VLSFLNNKRICVTGGAGFLGREVFRLLRAARAGAPFVPRSREFDLTTENGEARLYFEARSDVVIHLAAEVGGIGANERRPGRFFHANLAMGLHLIEGARRYGVEKFVQIGTVCSYPKLGEVPFREESLWSGFPEETNAPYGVAKRALAVMLEAYRREYGFRGIYLIPANLYGPNDNFDSDSSHVIAALIRRFTEAVDRGDDVVTCWGTGKASREFLYVDDAAEAIVKATGAYDESAALNIGTGREITIAELAGRIARLSGFHGRIEWDPSRPDGQPRRCLDSSRARDALNWTPRVDLELGLKRTIEWWRNVKPAQEVAAARC